MTLINAKASVPPHGVACRHQRAAFQKPTSDRAEPNKPMRVESLLRLCKHGDKNNPELWFYLFIFDFKLMNNKAHICLYRTRQSQLVVRPFQIAREGIEPACKTTDKQQHPTEISFVVNTTEHSHTFVPLTRRNRHQ